MRVSQAVLVLVASFLFTSEALSATMDSNQAQIAKMTSPGDQRLLRAYHKSTDEEIDSEDDSLEERGLNSAAKAQLARVAEGLGIDIQKAERSATYLAQIQQTAEYGQYKTLLEKLQKEGRSKKASQITYENHF
ncbi:RxLR effector protein [Phytophthora megakarya]|uniref:RxLR effector protein n=1 Tax=Phytophthora megakarya TaxID=4795 RepID=A0A225W3I1_9STRA|nr:RxLR effector protein [Phytophthora megakarya]